MPKKSMISTMLEKLGQRFDRFMLGVTFFHVAGIALMIGGASYGAQTKIGGTNLFGTGFDFGVTLSFAQIIGAMAFFYEMIKSRFKKDSPAPEKPEK